MQTFNEKLQDIVEQVLRSQGVELVDLNVKGKPGSQLVRVYVDCVGGITLDECEGISRQLSDELDIADIIPGRYRLEVSSPGISRPLLKEADFRRNINREVTIFYQNGADIQHFQGKIESVTADVVVLSSGNVQEEISIALIKKGVLSLPW